MLPFWLSPVSGRKHLLPPVHSCTASTLERPRRFPRAQHKPGPCCGAVLGPAGMPGGITHGTGMWEARRGQGQSLRDGWQDPSGKQKKKGTWNPAPNSMLSKRSRAGGSSCEVGDASWHWQGQGWHKSPPTAVTGAYFSKHITKEAKYTFSIQLPKAAIAQSLKINPFGLCPGQN